MSGHDTPAVTVTARQESRWRCGVQFTGSPQSFPAGHWSADELERLRGDSMLVVIEAGQLGVPVKGVAGALPAAMSVEEILDAAVTALRQATPEEVRGFLKVMEEDPDIRAQIEAAIVDRAAAEAAADAEPTRHEKLVAGIGELEEGNEDHWTKDKRPQVSALEVATGLDDVSSDERDAAFEAWKVTAGRDLTGG